MQHFFLLLGNVVLVAEGSLFHNSEISRKQTEETMETDTERREGKDFS